MTQHYERYTKEDQLVWKELFTRQIANLQDKACAEYLDCLDEMSPVLNAEAIPIFTELDRVLTDGTGWSIEVVPGHIPVNDFFALLSRRRFPSSTWLRSWEQFDYLEEPDMFHDIFGHVPLLNHKPYADFMERIGHLGVKWASNDSVVNALRSLYWFTIEFGLLTEHDERRIYGAGILSSFGESEQVMNASTECLMFEVDSILRTEFRTDVMQEVYYVAPSYKAFLDSIDHTSSLLSSAKPSH